MSNWTKELPTKPGLYAWCGTGKPVLAWVYFCGNGDLWVRLDGSAASPQKVQHQGGYWQPLTVELPAPYVPPNPPEVEWYRAKHCDSDDRLLLKIGDQYIAIALSDRTSLTRGEGRWESVNVKYSNVERIQ